MIIQRTPTKPNSLIYLKNIWANSFPKNCKMLDSGIIKILPKIWGQNKVTDYIKGCPFNFIDIMQLKLNKKILFNIV